MPIQSSEYKIYWKERRKVQEAITSAGCAIVEWRQGRVHVSAPYRTEFIQAAHRLNGRWRPRSRVWSFPPEAHKEVLAVCKEIYGRHKVVSRKHGMAPKESV